MRFKIMVVALVMSSLSCLGSALASPRTVNVTNATNCTCIPVPTGTASKYACMNKKPSFDVYFFVDKHAKKSAASLSPGATQRMPMQGGVIRFSHRKGGHPLISKAVQGSVVIVNLFQKGFLAAMPRALFSSVGTCTIQ